MNKIAEVISELLTCRVVLLAANEMFPVEEHRQEKLYKVEQLFIKEVEDATNKKRTNLDSLINIKSFNCATNFDATKTSISSLTKEGISTYLPYIKETNTFQRFCSKSYAIDEHDVNVNHTLFAAVYLSPKKIIGAEVSFKQNGIIITIKDDTFAFKIKNNQFVPVESFL